jgi:hypothetical protein
LPFRSSRVGRPAVVALIKLLIFCSFFLMSQPARAATTVRPEAFTKVRKVHRTAAPWTVKKRWVQVGKLVACDSAVFLIVGFGFVPLLRRAIAVPDCMVPILSSAIFGLFSFATFFVFLRSGPLGFKLVEYLYAACGVAFIGSLIVCRHRLGAALGGRDSLCVLILIGIATTVCLAVFYVPQTPADFSVIARIRGTPWGLPGDNTINEIIARYMAADLNPRHRLGEWLTSDRPPMQTGVQLICLPLAALLQYDRFEYFFPLAGVLFQTVWICGAWGLLRTAGCDRKRSMLVCLTLIPSGFIFVNMVFIWPKLCSAGFALAVLALLLSAKRKTISTGLFAGVCAALAMLCHGGSIFFLAPVACLALLPKRWPGIAAVMTALVVALLLYAPWIGYQKYFEPPGDRLIKMHLAGIEGIDPRKSSVVIREAYATAGWRRVIENKFSNFRMLFLSPSLPVSFKFDHASINNKRADIFFHSFRALGLLNLGWFAIPLVVRQKKWRQTWLPAIAICIGSLIFWCLIMFGPHTTSIHQGAYATQLLLMMICVVTMAFVSRWMLGVVAVANACLFFANYVPVTNAGALDSHGQVDYLAVLLLIIAIAVSLFLAFGGKFAAFLFDDVRMTSDR